MTHDTSDITGIILVGGRSSRMGRDKALLQIDGLPLVDRVLAAMSECFEQIVLVGDRKERFAGYGLTVLPDLYPGSALGGLYTGLVHAETDYLFVSSCDIPFPRSELIRFLCSQRDGYDAVVPHPSHGFEPLFALYARSCLEPIRQLLEQGTYRISDLYSRVRVRLVPDRELAPFDRDGRALLNVNTPLEFARAGGEVSP